MLIYVLYVNKLVMVFGCVCLAEFPWESGRVALLFHPSNILLLTVCLVTRFTPPPNLLVALDPQFVCLTIWTCMCMYMYVRYICIGIDTCTCTCISLMYI